MDALDRRLIEVWAANAAAFVPALRAIDPSWGSETVGLRNGVLVLSGRGLYVNRAMAAGIDAPLTEDDVDLIEARSVAHGVAPAVEVTPATHPTTVVLLERRGFRHDPAFDVVALVRPVDGPVVAAPADVRVERVGTRADLAVWQAVNARGWGHVDPDARRAAATYAAAAFEVDGDGMMLARDASDGRLLGCASTTIRDGVATLGGMSTLPEERRRGVQAALVAHRLALAAERGCDVAVATASSGGASQRNLRRHGFEPRFVVQTHRLASPP